MNKHILDITLLGVSLISEITIVKRKEDVNDKDVGLLIEKSEPNSSSIFIKINDWSEREVGEITLPKRTLPADYNDLNNYIRGRKVDILPESSSSNTIITNDGLILVLMDTSTAILVDMFEIGTATYESVDPVDYQLLINHITADPIKKRTFICYKENTTLVSDNTLIRQEGLDTYFYSEMDYPDLPTDEYGYYKAPTISSWNEVPITAAGPRNNRDTLIPTPVLGNTYFATDELKLYTYTEDWDDGVTVTSAGPIANRITLIPTPIPGNTYFATNESKLYEYIKSWNSTYNKIVDFSFLKKQFIVLELSGLSVDQNVSLTVKTGTNTENVEVVELLPRITETLRVYRLKYLSINNNDRYITFNLVPTGTTYCSVRIY